MLDIAPLGDRALTIRLGDTMDAGLAAHARALAAQVRSLVGVQDAVPGYATVTLFFDPGVTTYSALAEAAMSHAAPKAADIVSGAEHVIPVRYDGPDLAEIAQRLDLPVGEVIARHQAVVYTVYLVGFVPGFAYLGELDASLALPRRDTPRPRVPAGSVAIAGRQTAIYPLETPGGWHLIGHTDVRLFDPQADPPATFAAGDRVRFVTATP